MINLSFRDCRHDLYIVKVYDLQFKFNNLNKLKGFLKAFKIIGVESKDVYVYKINFRKENIYDNI